MSLDRDPSLYPFKRAVCVKLPAVLLLGNSLLCAQRAAISCVLPHDLLSALLVGVLVQNSMKSVKLGEVVDDPNESEAGASSFDATDDDDEESWEGSSTSEEELTVTLTAER